MKKFTSFSFFIFIILILFFCFAQTKKTYATDPQGLCTNANGTTGSSTQSDCTALHGVSWSQFGYCVFSNGTIESNWTNTECLSGGSGIGWSTNPPALGWCDVPGDQVYSKWTSVSCGVHNPRGKWTATAPAVGWCTFSGSTQAVSGWTEYDCKAHPGTWSATSPGATGWCDVPGDQVYQNWISTSCTSHVPKGNWTSTAPAVGWCDVPGEKIYTNWTQYDCATHTTKSNWTIVTPVVGWCTVSGSTQAVNGWTQYDCEVHPGTWSATDPTTTASPSSTPPDNTVGTCTYTSPSGQQTVTLTADECANIPGGVFTPSTSTPPATTPPATTPPTSTPPTSTPPTTTPPATTPPATTSAPTPDLSNRLVSCDNNCGFNDLMTMINNVIHFILFDMVVPIAAIMFAYAGFLMVTAGGEAAGARTKAKSIFTNAVIGLIIAVACWLIIRTILSILGFNGAWIGLTV